MKNNDSIFVLRDYGKIVFKFKDVMDQRHITRNKLATSAGIRFEVADRLYRGKTERLDMDILAKVCFILKCKVEDVLEYKS